MSALGREPTVRFWLGNGDSGHSACRLAKSAEFAHTDACRSLYGNLSLLPRQSPKTGKSLIGPSPTFDAPPDCGSPTTELASQLRVASTCPSELRYRHPRPQRQQTARSARFGHRKPHFSCDRGKVYIGWVRPFAPTTYGLDGHAVHVRQPSCCHSGHMWMPCPRGGVSNTVGIIHEVFSQQIALWFEQHDMACKGTVCYRRRPSRLTRLG